MKPSQLVNAIKHSFQIKQPVMIWGPPGIGKSRIVQDFAKDNNMGLIDIRLSIYDPTDLKGFPVLSEGKANWVSLGELPDVIRDGSEGILFLDEFNSAPPATAAAAYRLVLDRKIGTYTLPDGWSIVAAGNRESDKGVTYRMPAPLANRLVHLDLEPNYNDWLKWAVQNDLHYVTRSFIRYMPDRLFDNNNVSKAFPTPRTWEMADRYYKTVQDEQLLFDLVAGCVGEGPAYEYTSFAKMASQLVDPDQILLNPDVAPVPDDLQAQIAILGSLTSRVSPLTFDRLMRYVTKFKTEMQAFFVTDAVTKDKEITKTSSFMNWIVDNNDIIF